MLYRFYKRLCCLVCCCLLWGSLAAQGTNSPPMFEKAWKELDSLRDLGQVQTAQAALQALRKQLWPLRSEQAYWPDVLRYLSYQAEFEQFSEAGLKQAIAQMELDLVDLPPTLQTMMYSVLAEAYHSYYLTNRYQIRERTDLVDLPNPKDLDTWTEGQFIRQILAYYKRSLEGRALSAALLLKDWTGVLDLGENSSAYYVSLYDLLVHRALRYYESGEQTLHLPKLRFYLEEAEAFGSWSLFASKVFETGDSLSGQWLALGLYQTWFKHHEASGVGTRLHIDLRRLKFVYANSVHVDKKELYLKALEDLYQRYRGQAGWEEVVYHLASYHYEAGMTYKAGSGEDLLRWSLVKADTLAWEAVNFAASSYGGLMAKVLREQIKARSFSLEVERYVGQQANILVRVPFRNVRRLHWRLIPMTEQDLEKIDRLNTAPERMAYLAKIKVLRQGVWDLPNDGGDYQPHETEFGLAGLAYGSYAVLASAVEDFASQGNALAYAPFTVTDMVYVIHGRDEERGRLVLTHRQTGEPLAGVEIDLYRYSYSSLLRSYAYSKVTTLKTDKEGFALLPVLSNRDGGNYYCRFARGKDKIDERSFHNFYASEPYRDASERVETVFFLDRSMYRPGQTVYFKGIRLRRRGLEIVPRVGSEEAVKVVFYDANSQLVDSLVLKTSVYGTFHGEFKAPLGGLLGNMRLVDEEGGSRHYFRVEEYKRPKFEVKVLPIEGSLKLGEAVKVRGQAKAYAGQSIDGARVSYRVVRRASFPNWPWWRWGYNNPYQRGEQVLRTGELETDAQGFFELSFEALADKTIPEDRLPSFEFVVFVDVTDATGETRTAQGSLYLGYRSLALRLNNLPEQLEREEDFKGVELETSNPAGQFEPAQGTWVLERLQSPKQVYVQRLWSKPDMPSMDEKNFAKLFPNLAYAEEDQVQNWPVLAVQAQAGFNTAESKFLTWAEFKTWPQGTYRLTIKAQDAFGKPVELVQHFTLVEPKAKEVAANQALYLSHKEQKVLPNQTASFRIGSKQANAYVLVEIQVQDKILSRSWHKLNGVKTISLPITEAYRGNCYYRVSSTQQGRFYSEQGTILVPHEDKALDIEFTSFRDKLQPGQAETWTFKIKGAKDGPALYEVLASMYDASLDALSPHAWKFNPFRNYGSMLALSNLGRCFVVSNSYNLQPQDWNPQTAQPNRSYPELKLFKFNYYGDYEVAYRVNAGNTARGGRRSGYLPERDAMPAPAPAMLESRKQASPDFTMSRPEEPAAPDAPSQAPPNLRTNLKETVFFFPQMQTDAEGNLQLSFTMNEALTRWKFQILALGPQAAFALEQRLVETQKELMIQPNAPRFFRQGDTLRFPAKISNLSAKTLNGKARIELLRASNGESLNHLCKQRELTFELKTEQSKTLFWELVLPQDLDDALVYRLFAQTSDFSDGEEDLALVLSNRILMTESLSFPIKGKSEKTFEFSRFTQLSQSPSLRQHSFSLEFTQNPIWLAVKALPYLMEYPHQCTEQIFSRLYANGLARHIVQKQPRIQAVFEAWKTAKAPLESELLKNQELKYALIEETPWVLQAQSETQQRQNIGLLFDLHEMAQAYDKARNTLLERQSANGGFSWFAGGPDNYYISQYLVQGFGQLQNLGLKELNEDRALQQALNKALSYLDQTQARDYEALQKRLNAKELEEDQLGHLAIHYLYTRSFFLNQSIAPKKAQEAEAYYLGQAKRYWNKKSLYMQGLLALSLHRRGEVQTAQLIVRSLREKALQNEELGMYWKQTSGLYWYEHPIETHALLLEVFEEVAQDAKSVELLKIWLLKNKQTTHWPTTKATASACYALLLRGQDWLSETGALELKLGGAVVDFEQAEAGTGYVKRRYQAQDIKPEMAKIALKNPNTQPAWGAAYWQYFEDLDKVQGHQGQNLNLVQSLYKKVETDRGPVLEPITANSPIRVGDLIQVRLEIRTDRDLEFVHLKDHRASGFEPVNVLSGYRYQAGLGYYEMTKDAATHFFFDYLPKGTYVFEYALRAQHVGQFSNGLSSLQCMYAPEFTTHSQGIRVKIEPRD